MKTIQILGTGCPKCEKLAQNAREAADTLGMEYEIIKIKEVKEIVKMGVMLTPGLAVDGQVKSSGKLLSPSEIIPLIAG